MKRVMTVCAFAVCLPTAPAWASKPAVGTDWPQWRGTHNNGVGAATAIPDEWSSTTNVKWKVSIPGRGHATPVIVGDRVFVVTAIETDKAGRPGAEADEPSGSGRSSREGGRLDREEGRRRPGRFGRGGRGRGRRGGFGGSTPTNIHRFVLLCLDRRTGSTIWEKTAAETLPHAGYHRQYGSLASASPVVEEGCVYISFGSQGVYCYDLDGNLKWKRDLGRMQIRFNFGEGSSPAVHENALVLAFDHEGDSFLIALDKKTGETLWRTARNTRAAWSTPLIVEVNGQSQVIVNGDPAVRAYDLATGREIWHCNGMTDNAIPSAVQGHGMVFATTGFRGSALRAIRLGSTGDLTESDDAIAWRLDRGTPYVPTPLLYGDELYLLLDRGQISCYDARTGKPHYEQERLPGATRGRFHASPVGAGNRIYVLNEDGTCFVLKRGTQFEVVAVNELNESVSASPAIAGGDLFLRGHEHLYCIGTTNRAQ